MGIGYKELMILMSLFAVPCIVIGAVVWIIVRFVVQSSRRSSLPGGPRVVADRLVELDSLLRAGHITTDEHAKQRASIISGV